MSAINGHWRHYHSHKVRTLNFLAYPLVTKCPPPLPAPNGVLVGRGSWNTTELIYPVYIYLGSDGDSTAATPVITVTTVSGTVTQFRTLSIFTGIPKVITLLPNTVHLATVYAQFENGSECSYVTSTSYHLNGSRLIINQGSTLRTYLPLILR